MCKPTSCKLQMLEAVNQQTTAEVLATSGLYIIKIFYVLHCFAIEFLMFTQRRHLGLTATFKVKLSFSLVCGPTWK